MNSTSVIRYRISYFGVILGTPVVPVIFVVPAVPVPVITVSAVVCHFPATVVRRISRPVYICKHVATLGSRVAIVVTLALFIVLARSVYVHAPSLSYRYILDSAAHPLAWLSCGVLATPHVDIHAKLRLTRHNA